MEDLSDVLRRHYCGLYKKKQDTFGTVKDRVAKMNEQRRNQRHEGLFEKRKIPLNMSPAVTPAPKREKVQEKPVPQPSKRLEMLAKWKADKERRKQEEKRNKKPVFKVAHIPVTVGLPNLETVNKEIKGKPFTSKFAPSNHQFKPPSNIKPLNLNANINSSKSKLTKDNKKTDTSTHRMTTRSQTRGICQKEEKTNDNKTPGKRRGRQKTGNNKKNEDINNKRIEEINNKTLTDGTKNNEEIRNQEAKKTENISLMSPDFPVQNVLASDTDDVKTPEKTHTPTYVSPFVTISRGKDNARKEYKIRRSGKSFSLQGDSKDCTSPKAGAAYFSWVLNQQTSRLQSLCSQWLKYKEAQDPPEEAISMIDVAIGQTNLLLTKKFMQFKGLIDKCKDATAETPVTCEDLHGFWDMVHLQVDNLDKRFDNLIKLKQNNWQEILPVVRKGIVKKQSKTTKIAKPSSGLREAIQAARRKKVAKNEHLQEEVIVVTKTPKNRRNSRLGSVMSEEKKTHRNSSPGLMMMKVAQFAKSVETSAKSILKNDNSRSVKSQSKTVLFQDEVEKLVNLENDLNVSNVRSKSKTPKRTSTRLRKSKLF